MLILIKFIHSLIWAIMVFAIFYIIYAGLTGDLDVYLWISVGLMALEGIVLLVNRGTCPLTTVARTVKKNYEEGDDIYLPRWLAAQNKKIFGSLLLLGLILVLLRLLGAH